MFLLLTSLISSGFCHLDTCGYFPAPHAEPGNDFCENEQFYDIAALPNTGGELFWYLDEEYTIPVGNGSFCMPLNIIGTTTYYVVAIENGCVNEASTVNVTVYPAPALTTIPISPVSINSGATVSLFAIADETAIWNDSIISDSLLVSMPGLYQVSVSNEWGCVSLDTIEVVYANDNPMIDTLSQIETIHDHIFVPNAFTPNNDGINDIFLPVTPELETYLISIFNHWGKLVFQSINPNEPWLGGQEYYGKSEIYTYWLQATAKNQLYEKMGFVVLIR
jgi:large repetitive protein